MNIVSIISKISIKTVVIVLAISVALFGIFKIDSYFKSKGMETYKRQLAGQLSTKEKEIEALNTKLGVAQSTLVDQKALNAQLKNDKDLVNSEFDKFKKDHNLVTHSVDTTVNQVTGTTTGGASTSTTTNGIISYEWSDLYKRFQLKVPNILVQGGEVFTNTQMFKIDGEIDAQAAKDGSLETRRMVMHEVVKDKDGKYINVEGSNVTVVDSTFIYTNKPVKVRDSFFNPRLIVLGLYNFNDFQVGLGIELIHYKSFGLNTFTAFDPKDISKSGQHIGLLWSPKMFGTIPINLAIGPSIGTQFTDLFHKWVVGLDFAVYLNN